METRKWLIIARNEYRIRVNSVGKLRPYFPYLIIGFLAVYVGIIAPALINLFLDDVVAFFLSQVAVTMIPLLMFMLFFYIILLPITSTLQGMHAGQVEIFLAAPVQPSEILLGEFLGMTPFYGVAIVLLAGFFAAALNPLGLDWVQITLTVLIFVLTLLAALWIGTVIAALLRTRLAQSQRGRDLGKAFSLVLALPMIAVIYAIFSGSLVEALTKPGTSGIVQTILRLLPSSWGAELIVSFASHPGNLAASGVEGMIKFIGLGGFFVVMLWLGSKAAKRVYSVEPTTFTASHVKPDGFFYRMIRHLGKDGSFSTLLLSLIKNYARRLENLSRIIYIIGLVAMLNIFFGARDVTGSFMMVLFLTPFLTVFIVGSLGTSSKDNLLLYKKTPSGISKFIKAMLLQGWLVAIPVGVLIISITMIATSQITLITLLAYIGFVAQLIAGNGAAAVGLSILNPSFSENVREQMVGLIINAQVATFSSMGILFGSLLVLRLQLVEALLLNTAGIWILGIMFLYVGQKKLSNIE
ncbi:MAG: hypothetical protein ACFFCP_15815 [Promethearchaeota archaeon]